MWWGWGSGVDKDAGCLPRGRRIKLLQMIHESSNHCTLEGNAQPKTAPGGSSCNYCTVGYFG